MAQIADFNVAVDDSPAVTGTATDTAQIIDVQPYGSDVHFRVGIDATADTDDLLLTDKSITRIEVRVGERMSFICPSGGVAQVRGLVVFSDNFNVDH